MNKFRKFEIITVTTFFVVSLFVLNAVYAQDRTTDVKIISSDENVKVDESKVLTREEEFESVKVISETVDQIRTQALEVEDSIKDTVKEGIDKNIIEIRKKTDLPAYELQKAVDSDRINLFDSLSKELGDIKMITSDSISDLPQRVEKSVQNIEKSLETRSGLQTNFEQEKAQIRNVINVFVQSVEQKREIIAEREGNKVFEDTDGDGLSDYDERYIYNTDPEKSSTFGDNVSDSEKIENGIDPLTGNKISYSDPREDKDSFVTYSYRLESVSLKEEDKSKVVFEGVALPNSLVTIYIYSTPIVVTVKTDNNGNWNYELEEELENGEHQLYVATVNNTGKIIARSNPTTFTKTAEAASIGIVGIDLETSNAGDFFRDNFILLSLAILIAIVILAVMLAGRKRNVKDIVNELKKEIDNPQDTNLK